MTISRAKGDYEEEDDGAGVSFDQVREARFHLPEFLWFLDLFLVVKRPIRRLTRSLVRKRGRKEGRKERKSRPCRRAEDN